MVWGSETLLALFNGAGITSQSNHRIVDPLEVDSAADGVETLGNTPDKVNELVPSPLARTYGHSTGETITTTPRSHLQPRCLLENAPKPVKDLLSNRPTPKVSASEKPPVLNHCTLVTFVTDEEIQTSDPST